MAENNKVIGNGPVIGNISKKLNLNIKNGSVTTDKIAAKAVTMDKLGDDVTQYLREILPQTITSAEMDTVLGGSPPVYLVDANGVAILDDNGNPIEII